MDDWEHLISMQFIIEDGSQCPRYIFIYRSKLFVYESDDGWVVEVILIKPNDFAQILQTMGNTSFSDNCSFLSKMNWSLADDESKLDPRLQYN